MEKGAKKKLQVSNGALVAVLGGLVVIIICLVVGIVVIPKVGEQQGGGGGEIVAEKPKSNYEIAQESCQTMEELRQPEESNKDEFKTAVESFEGVIDDEKVDGNDEFNTCYTYLVSYYTVIDKNSKKADYYGSIYEETISDEEKEVLEAMRKKRGAAIGEEL